EGARVATAGLYGVARMWVATSAAVLTEAGGHRARVWQVAFSPDGRRVATASEDGSARVWDVATGAGVTPFLRHKGTVTTVAFSPDGSRLATGSFVRTPVGNGAVRIDTGEVRIWDAATGESVTPPLKHKETVQQPSFSPDGRFVLSA